MSDRVSAATAAANGAVDDTIEAYVATWNETDAGRRQAGIARTWANNGRYRDPLMASDGHAAIDAMLAQVQARFPGFVLRRTSKVDCHNGSARFAWSLGPASGPSVVRPIIRSPMIELSSTRLAFCGSRVWGSELLPYSRQALPAGQAARCDAPWQAASASAAAAKTGRARMSPSLHAPRPPVEDRLTTFAPDLSAA